MRPLRPCKLVIVLLSCMTQGGFAQQALTWQQVREKFESANPSLRAGEINIAESRAQEITAYLRPNPQVSTTLDQIGNTASGNVFSASTVISSLSYLHERQGKRELRRESAQKGTA